MCTADQHAHMCLLDIPFRTSFCYNNLHWIMELGSKKKALVRSGTDGRRGCIRVHPVGVQWGFCAGCSSSSTPNLALCSVTLKWFRTTRIQWRENFILQNTRTSGINLYSYIVFHQTWVQMPTNQKQDHFLKTNEWMKNILNGCPS